MWLLRLFFCTVYGTTSIGERPVSWVAASLLSAFLFAIVSVLDKRILTRYVPSVLLFSFIAGLFSVVISVAIFIAVPWKGGASATALLVAIGAGMFGGLQLFFLFYGMRILEVSRVIPIFHTYPVATAIMAIFLLDEGLLPIHWVAIVVTTLGGGLVAIERGGVEGRKNSHLLAYLSVVLAAIFFALNHVSTKFALEGLDFWNLYSIRGGIMGLLLMAPLMRPRVVPELRKVLANRDGVRLLVVNEGVLAGIAVFLLLLAINLGPVSLVATLTATRPFLVLIISALLSTRVWNLLDEPLKRDTLVQKLLSTGMIVGGVSVLILV